MAIPKGRNTATYQRKLKTLKAWHSRRTESRKSWSKERLEKSEKLKPLEWYTEKLKKPNSK